MNVFLASLGVNWRPLFPAEVNLYKLLVYVWQLCFKEVASIVIQVELLSLYEQIAHVYSACGLAGVSQIGKQTRSQLREIALFIQVFWTSEKVRNLNKDILISPVLKLDLEKLRINIKK